MVSLSTCEAVSGMHIRTEIYVLININGQGQNGLHDLSLPSVYPHMTLNSSQAFPISNVFAHAQLKTLNREGPVPRLLLGCYIHVGWYNYRALLFFSSYGMWLEGEKALTPLHWWAPIAVLSNTYL